MERSRICARRRILAGQLALALMGVLLAASAAHAQPTYSLVWSATTGSGTPGSDTIDAAPGDLLTLDVIINIDATGFTGAAWDLVGSAGLTATTTIDRSRRPCRPDRATSTDCCRGTCTSCRTCRRRFRLRHAS